MLTSTEIPIWLQQQEDQPDEEFLLVELPKDLAAEIASGNVTELVVRGPPDANAVVCTRHSTYAARKAETSNTLLVLGDPHKTLPGADTTTNRNSKERMEEDCMRLHVRGCMNSYVELEKVDTRYASKALLEHLEGSAYRGPYHEPKMKDVVKMYQWEDLCNVIQASDAEIRIALNEVGGFELDGFYRLVDHSFLYEFLRLFLVSAEIQEVDIMNASLDEVAQVMSEEEYPREVVLQCFKLVADPLLETLRYKVSEYKVVRVIGKYVLMNIAMNPCAMGTFLEEWRKATPGIFEIKMETLKGLCIRSGEAEHLQKIQYFPKSALPSGAKERLERLFSVRSKWDAQEMTPYIDDLAENDKKLQVLLLKYARASKTGDTTYYTSRMAM